MKTIEEAERIEILQQFTSEFFTEDAVLKGRLWDPNITDKDDGRYEIPQSSVARYFQIQYQGGIEKIYIATGGTTPKPFGNGSQLLHCPSARFTYCYKAGSQVSALAIVSSSIKSDNVGSLCIPGRSTQ